MVSFCSVTFTVSSEGPFVCGDYRRGQRVVGVRRWPQPRVQIEDNKNSLVSRTGGPNGIPGQEWPHSLRNTLIIVKPYLLVPTNKIAITYLAVCVTHLCLHGPSPLPCTGTQTRKLCTFIYLYIITCVHT